MPMVTSMELTPREREDREFEREMWDKKASHAIEIKKLEIESEKQHNRLSAWFSIPITIVKLPIFLLFGVGYIIHVIRKTEPSEKFWFFLR